MSEFTNVTIIKKANIYFDGKVSSRTIKFADGSTKTLGFMLPGEYEFNTDAEELMEFMAGKLEYQLAGSSDWLSIDGEGSFAIPACSSFKLKVTEAADYCCSYID